MKKVKFKQKLFASPLAIIVIIISFNWTYQVETSDPSEIVKWKLGWRLIISSMEKNYQLGEKQFDSLLKMNGRTELKFLVAGLDILSKLDRREKIINILNQQDQLTLEDICSRDLFTKKLNDVQICKSVPTVEKVGNKTLQIELIKMYINDQAVRGNVLYDLVTKYKLEEFEITKLDGISIDKINRERLNEIITEFGFPSKKLVGRDAMQGVFLIIQHSDEDREWQKKHLPNIERAVKNGEMDSQSYAYLYDRIKINAGEKQLYGTQFKNVDSINKKVELADTEDIENLDNRRMEFGMMPIKMYEQFMLKNISK